MVKPDAATVSFKHRLGDWRHLTDYRHRHIIATGKRSVLVEYRPAFPVPRGGRILFFSDLHWRQDADTYRDMIRDVIKYVELSKPDMVIFGGDLLSYMCYLTDAAAALREISAPVKIAVAGNWERRRHWIGVEQWREYFALGGFQLILQEWYCRDGLCVFGADDSKSGQPSPPSEFPDGFRILAAHNPDTVINMGRRDILKKFRLALCGHTHGGQIRMPFWGPFRTSSRYGTRFDYGTFYNEKTDTFMIISAGMGYTLIRRRLLCQSEAMLIEL